MKGSVRGLDIGCGANLIYPLLGAAICGWRFLACDITPEALRGAACNLGANPHLGDLIELRDTGANADPMSPDNLQHGAFLQHPEFLSPCQEASLKDDPPY